MYVLNVRTLTGGKFDIGLILRYEDEALRLVGDEDSVTLMGDGPPWLFLRLAHVLSGKVRHLWYDSAETGKVLIF